MSIQQEDFRIRNCVMVSPLREETLPEPCDFWLRRPSTSSVMFSCLFLTVLLYTFPLQDAASLEVVVDTTVGWKTNMIHQRWWLRHGCTVLDY